MSSLPDGPLIDVSTLRAQRSRVTLLDVRWRLGAPHGAAEYAAGHVPGAVYVDLETDLSAPAGDPPGAAGRHPLPDAAAFGAAMRKLGVRHDRPVVVYDDWGGLAAARAWWLLRHHGHDRVLLLDGGWGAWSDAGGAVELTDTAERPAARGDFESGPGRSPVLDAAAAALVAQRGVLVDARSPERFRGEVEPVDPVAGHVPGARNVPTTANLGPDGRFLAPAELATAYDAVGARPGADVGVYCGSGVTACHDVLALELTGVHAALYAGSWSGWVSDPDRPVDRVTSGRRGTSSPA